jgi:hypothetical protein
MFSLTRFRLLAPIAITVLGSGCSGAVETSEEDVGVVEAALVDGTYEWRHGNATFLALDSNWAGEVYLLQANGGNFQKWDTALVSTLNGGQFRLKDKATGRCLDSNAAGHVYTLACNGGNFQRWKYLNSDLVNVATGRCLDDNNEGDTYTLACNGGSFQNWFPI